MSVCLSCVVAILVAKGGPVATMTLTQLCDQNHTIATLTWNNGPKAKSIKDDPFMKGLSGPNVKDYGNIACKVRRTNSVQHKL